MQELQIDPGRHLECLLTRGLGLEIQSVFQVREEPFMIWMLIVGLVVGVVAKLLMPGRDPGGAIVTIFIGIAGSVVAGFLGRSIGLYRDGDPVGFFASVLGAIVLLVLYRVLVGRSGIKAAT